MREHEIEELCSRALKRYGSKLQLDMLQEECGELVAAVNQYRRGRISTDELVSEMADVRVMLRQMAILFRAELPKIEAEKYERLRQRLAGEGEFEEPAG